MYIAVHLYCTQQGIFVKVRERESDKKEVFSKRAGLRRARSGFEMSEDSNVNQWHELSSFGWK